MASPIKDDLLWRVLPQLHTLSASISDSIFTAVAFATTSPINGVLLWCVPPQQRTLSMALAVIGMHLLGDVPSPVVVGAMLENLGDDSLTMTLVTVSLGSVHGAVCMFARCITPCLSQNPTLVKSPVTRAIMGICNDDWVT